ncbi:dihydrofolate reductase [candidate division WWE3 bacterium]|nr:dihydrofolate reductase [candidate division WWE3 bacterium]
MEPNSSRLKVSIIAAVSDHGCIGLRGALPWDLHTDLRRFARITAGQPVIMGRSTWESIVAMRGGALPGRTNIVLTSQVPYRVPDDVIVVNSLHRALLIVPGDSVFVIGGASLYAPALPLATSLHITWVHARIVGDRHFPAFNPANWDVVTTEEVSIGPQDQYASTYTLYKRRVHGSE